jgi:hypothetical protein
MEKGSLILIAVVVIAMLFIGCTEKRVPSDSLTHVKKTVLPSELTEIGGYKYYQGEFSQVLLFTMTKTKTSSDLWNTNIKTAI